MQIGRRAVAEGVSPTETLTIYCIGTGHAQDETWNLLVALHDLTEADDLTLAAVGHGALSPARHVKVLLDGPEMAGVSNSQLDVWAEAAVRFIETNRPARIQLVGHSRGAVLCMMIAARLFFTVRHDQNLDLFLVDAVAVTDWRGGPPVLSASEALTTYPNVRSLVRVVMEDEGGIFGFFPLEEIHVSDGAAVPRSVPDHAYDGQLTRIEFIRLPGTHGTATQVNKVHLTGDPLLPGRIKEVDPVLLWPIGEACLIHALTSLRQWGVPLHPKADAFTGRLLEAYAGIRLLNRRRATDRKLMVNNVGLSRPGAKQEVLAVKGLRPDRDLNRYGPGFRDNVLVVNSQHLAALEALTGPTLAQSMRLAGSSAGQDLSLSPRDVDTLRQIHPDHPRTFNTLALQGYRVDGKRLAEAAR